MGRIEFFGTGANAVTEVSSAQTIAVVRTPVSAATFGIAAVATAVVPTEITASSKGYLVAAGAVPTAFGDNLNISMTQTSATSTVDANGNNLTLSVSALAQSGTTGVAGTVTGIDTGVTVTGDLVGLTATLTSVRGSGTNGLGLEELAGLTVVVDATELTNMTSVNVSGAGTVSIDASTIATAGKLTTINLSGMTAFADLNALGQEIGLVGTTANTVGGYKNLSTSTVTLSDTTAETVTLGGAKDTVVTGSTIVVKDTITGFKLVASAADPLAADADRSDVLSIAGGTNVLDATNSVKITVTGSTIEAALLQAASAKAADGTDRENVVFHFGGDTYFYQDAGTAGLTDDDFLVRMTGTLNLDLLLTSGVIIV